MPTRPFPLRAAALAAVGAALAVGCATRSPAEPFTMVTLDEVERMLGDPRVAIVDANTPDSFKEAHVPGARWYREGPSLAAVLPADKTTRVVFYCSSPS